MKYKLILSNSFQKDLAKAIKQKRNIALLDIVVDLLLSDKKLPAKNKDHALTGNYTGCRECHIQPDWLLIYTKQN